MVSKAERDAMRARAEAATPGPWRAGSAWTDCVMVPHHDGLAGPGGERVVLRMNAGFPHEADAAFIAHARTDVPRLLDALDEAETEIAPSPPTGPLWAFLLCEGEAIAMLEHDDRLDDCDMTEGSYFEPPGDGLWLWEGEIATTYDQYSGDYDAEPVGTYTQATVQNLIDGAAPEAAQTEEQAK